MYCLHFFHFCRVGPAAWFIVLAAILMGSVTGCSTLTFRESGTLNSISPHSVQFRKRINLKIQGFGIGPAHTGPMRAQQGQGEYLLRTYLYAIPLFNVLENRQAEEGYVVTGDVERVGARDFGDEYIFSSLSNHRTRVVFARVTLLVTDPKTHAVIKNINSEGEYLVSAPVSEGDERLVTNPALRQKAVDIAIREAVRQLESEMVVMAY